MQLVADADEFKFDFDLLDPTKIIPEEQVPVWPVGKMVLERAAQIQNRLADDTEVVSDQAVVTTTAAADELPEEFVDQFAAALADHRCSPRQTDPVPA